MELKLASSAGLCANRLKQILPCLHGGKLALWRTRAIPVRLRAIGRRNRRTIWPVTDIGQIQKRVVMIADGVLLLWEGLCGIERKENAAGRTDTVVPQYRLHLQYVPLHC